MKKEKIFKIDILENQKSFLLLLVLALLILGISAFYLNTCLLKNNNFDYPNDVSSVSAKVESSLEDKKNTQASVQEPIIKSIINENSSSSKSIEFIDNQAGQDYKINYAVVNANFSFPVKKNLPTDYFGDLFSSDVYINSAETNMFFDEKVTAYTFKPIFELNEINSKTLGKNVSDLIEKNRQQNLNNNSCLLKNCLSLKNENLFFNGKIIALPLDLQALKKEGKIINLSIGSLETKWLIGAVVGRDSDEYALVYYFDGKNFQPLISLNSSAKIKPDYGRKGGEISFGGYDNDFLIVYGGYNGIAYRVRGSSGQETFTDLSRFFGLRVTDEGIKTQVSVSGRGNEATWYVSGRNARSFRIVKLWQNKTSEVIGAIDLGNIIFNSNQDSQSIIKFKKEVNDNQFVFLSDPDKSNNLILVFFSSVSNANISSTWRIIDKGFNNTNDYKIVSNNLNSSSKYIAGAMIKRLEFEGNFKIFLSNNKKNWLEPKLGSPVYFSDQKSSGLYWEALAPKDGNQYYSPFFDNLLSLEYYYGN